MSDQTFDGTKLRVLTIVDAPTRLSPAIDVRTSYRALDVVVTLERATAIYGLPKRICTAQGTEFTRKRGRSLGLEERPRHGLQPAGKADGQRLRRGLQPPSPG